MLSLDLLFKITRKKNEKKLQNFIEIAEIEKIMPKTFDSNNYLEVFIMCVVELVTKTRVP